MFMPGWLTWALKTLIAKSKPIQDIKTSVTESISVEAFLTPLKTKKKIKESDLIGCRYNLSIKWGKTCLDILSEDTCSYYWFQK